MAITSLFLAIVMIFSSVGAFAQSIDTLLSPMTNYSLNGNVSVSFDSCEDILALMNEVDSLETVEKFIDLKSFLTSLGSYEEGISLQFNASEDYKKIEYAAVSDVSQLIEVNPNLNVGINTKVGAWIKSDFTDEKNPSVEITVVHPFLNKYMTISLSDVLKELEENEIAQISAVMNSAFKQEYIDYVTTYYGELIAKYAKTSLTGNKYTIKIDNDGLISMIEDFVAHLPELISPMLQAANISEDETTEIFKAIDSFPSIKGIQLLGEDGITSVYTLSGKNITASSFAADISIDISKIYEMVTGGEWEYEASALIDFTVKSEQKYSNIGKTKVSFPALNDENSFSYKFFESSPDYEYGEYEEYVPDYPYYWVSGEELLVVDGNFYVPLRYTLTEAFDDSVAISYDNGTIMLTSDYFPGFKNIALYVGGDKAYTEYAEYHIGQVILQDGTTYVSSKMFEDMLGWELVSVTHDLLEGTYSYDFITERD